MQDADFFCNFAPEMTGTIVNTCAIVVGTLVGAVLNRGIKEKYKVGLYDALGLASLAIGLNLLKLKELKTLNMLPSLLVPVVWFVIKAVLNI